MQRALVIIVQGLAIVAALPLIAGHRLSSDPSICAYTTSNHLTYPECSRELVSTRRGVTETTLAGSNAIVGAATTTQEVPFTSQYKSYSSSSHVTSSSASLSTQLSTTEVPPDTTKPEPTTKPDDTDADNYLDPSSFLSFDEWKSQNFANAGLSSEDMNKRSADLASAARRSSPEQPLDTIGDDMEVDLPLFSQTQDTADEGAASIMEAESEKSPLSEEARGRSKDAGKTSRERSNYASTACAAGILKTNPEMRGASAILFENKDTYMLNPCSVSNKFVIIELCEDIQIDTVVLANYEFFSSMVRKFRVSASTGYPVKVSGWTVLGEFEARNVREIQPFLVRNSLIWARFLRIEFLSHWGHEFYCPLSLVRVHGTTMMEEYWYQEKLNRGEEDEREDVVAEAVAPEVYAEQMQANEGSAVVESLSSEEAAASGEVMRVSQVVGETSPAIDIGFVIMELPFCPCLPDLYTRKYLMQISDPVLDAPLGIFEYYSDENAEPRRMKPVTVPARIMPSNTSSPENSNGEVSGAEQARSSSTTKTSAERTSTEASSVIGQDTQKLVSSSSEHRSTEREHIHADPAPSSQRATSSPTSTSTTSISSTSSSASLSSTPNNPTTQESVYKTIMKRLTLLEANATLSLQYIEEQSRMLRDAFSKVERRQNLKITDMLDGLNATVTSQLYVFKQQYEQQRQQYEQLWQQTVTELESQRKRTERHLLEIVILLFCVCTICVAFDVYIVMKMKIKIL
ncbi:UNC-like C-terminal-domain-containing protein [Lipomyces chichibuensis]|uniref:UNC-like C-terminal-domain-containing protein n=1 Tax=Lipomyces chichibuensis TaxID=1546026 RepID=UPI0033440046